MTFKALLLCTLALVACSPAAASPPPTAAPFAIEIVVRTPATLRRAEDVAALVDQAVRHGVAVINVLVKQDEDGAIESGRVFYASRIAPVAAGYEGFDVLQSMLAAARGRPIRIRAWIPQFHDQVAARRHPAWQMQALSGGRAAPYTGSKNTEFFVDPLNPEVQAYELSIIREVTSKYAVDGVMLDWIRFDNFNMDLGDDTRQRYLALRGQDPAAIDFTQPGPAREQWNEFRTDGIAAYVRSVRQALASRLELGIYVLPPEFIEVGQDVAKFHADTAPVAPMCYFKDWGFAIDWFWTSCIPSAVQKAGSSAVVPTIGANLGDEQYGQMFTRLRRDFPQIKTLAWFQHEQWSEELLQRIARLSAK